MEGLFGISGERIWMELKKILSSRYAGNLLGVMLDLGIAPYIGLPKNINLNEFTTVWKRVQNNNIQLQPITLMSTLLYTQEEVYPIPIKVYALITIEYKCTG